MVRDRIPVQRPSVEMPKDAAGLTAVIEGLKELYPDKEGHGPEILRALKVQIARVATTEAETAALQEVFDNKLSQLALKDMDKFPDKKERLSKGFNAVDHASHQRILEMFLTYDIPQLPMFSEERREALMVAAKQKIWAKGYVPHERDE